MEPLLPDTHVNTASLTALVSGPGRVAKKLPDAVAREWDMHMASNMNAEPLSYPAMEKSVAEMAGKLGLNYSPGLYRSARLPWITAGSAPNVFALTPRRAEYGGAILVTDSARKLLHDAPEELQAIMAHELAHIKQGPHVPRFAKRAPLYIGTALGIGAAVLLDKAMSNKKKDKKDITQQDLEDVLQDECACKKTETSAHNPVAESVQGFLNEVKQAAKYFAGGMVGFSAGACAARQSVIEFEHQADKVSAMLMQSPEPFISGLQKLSGGMREYAQEHSATIIKNLSARDLLLLWIDDAHPTFDQRVTRLRSPETLRAIEEFAAQTASHAL